MSDTPATAEPATAPEAPEASAAVTRRAVVSAPMTPMRPRRVEVTAAAETPAAEWEKLAVKAAGLADTALSVRVRFEE